MWIIYGQPECFKQEDVGYISYVLTDGETVKNKNGEIEIGTGYFDYKDACVVRTKHGNIDQNRSSYSTQINVCKPKNVYDDVRYGSF